MSNIALVTVSFNQASYIEECLSSVVGQLSGGDRYAVIDAGSVDSSRLKISNYAQKTPNLITVFEPDKGAADGLNRGFNTVGGDILGYINSDDFLFPGCLAHVRKFFENNPAIDVYIGAVKICNENGVISRRGRVADRVSLSRIAAGSLFYVQQGTFFRRSIWSRTKGFNIENRTCWDYELIVDMALAGATFYRDTKPVAAFRMHRASITGAGLNRERYIADKARIRAKVIAETGCRESLVLRKFYAIEAKLNPLRYLRQFEAIG